MKICSRVAHNIRDIRHYRGLSQEALAENAGVSRGYMGTGVSASGEPPIMRDDVDPTQTGRPRALTNRLEGKFIIYRATNPFGQPSCVEIEPLIAKPCFDAALTNRAFVRQVAGLPFHPDA